MGIFDAIIKGVGSQILGGTPQVQGGLVEQILGLINNPQTGGLSGLIEQFTNKGLGDAVSSWVSTGENQPVSGEQIEQMLGSEKIQEIAQNLGISGADASGGFAALLPQIIDKLTPEGTVPEGGILEQGIGLLKKTLLGG
ncbi:MAG: hypothetical protein A4E63_01395 [Syntrophorhabdus sp. PtaU1.Bin050]|jgi:uncharacterized protein YidB (DUF937 family)|nr:MAG: hypothetical protein A4E63_01395 [Syntrophorhabdus sp. PtaU1.Bin050]